MNLWKNYAKTECLTHWEFEIALISPVFEIDNKILEKQLRGTLNQCYASGKVHFNLD